jgi:hypothetical protein
MGGAGEFLLIEGLKPGAGTGLEGHAVKVLEA